MAAIATRAAGTMAESPCAPQAPDTLASSAPPSDEQAPQELPQSEESPAKSASGPHTTSDNTTTASPAETTDPAFPHVPFCQKSAKTRSGIRVKPASIDVAQPLAPALAASSHALATIPLAPAIGAAYPFPALTAAPHLLPHQLVSLPLQAPRRAVRIAPMGVMPLPPPGAAALVADFHAAVIAEDNPRLNELSKSKRRTSTASAVVPEQVLSPEEMARQKRMLRNRESAARSRDKRRNRNIQLQSSIERYRNKKKEMDSVIQELNALCQTMRSALEKYNLSVSTP